MGNRMRRTVLLPALWLGCSAVASAGDAPFGLAWGPVDTVPKPSMVDREANITALIYLQGRAPASGPDTEEVVLEVCRDEGLQQVIWLSRPLAEAEMPGRFEAIRREGVLRHGPPDSDDGAGTVAWYAARALLTVRRAPSGERRLLMVSRGDGYEACSGTHRTLAGHPAGQHVTRLLDAGFPKP